MPARRIESIIEGVLFAAGEIVPLGKIADAVNMDKAELKPVLNEMVDRYLNSSRGIFIREINEGYQLCTKPEIHDYVQKLFEAKKKHDLSQAAYETLAIIAYNQPIGRSKIETIRGVNSDSSISKLLEWNLIREEGRSEAVGRPILYGTTEDFLRSFGFKSLSDLPPLEG